MHQPVRKIKLCRLPSEKFFARKSSQFLFYAYGVFFQHFPFYFHTTYHQVVSGMSYFQHGSKNIRSLQTLAITVFLLLFFLLERKKRIEIVLFNEHHFRIKYQWYADFVGFWAISIPLVLPLPFYCPTTVSSTTYHWYLVVSGTTA